MKFEKLNRRFQSSCYRFHERVSFINGQRSKLSTWKINYLTEALLLDVWHCWNDFNRTLINYSCVGDIARDGSIVQGRAGDNTWQRVGYEARILSKNGIPQAHRTISFIRHEPTWGDIEKLVLIVRGLGISNENSLLAAYGSFTTPKHMQITRNACAHINRETIDNVKAIVSAYSFSRINRPSDLLWAVATGRSEFAIEFWIYEMGQIANLATESSL